jgi:hypothetical protein
MPTKPRFSTENTRAGKVASRMCTDLVNQLIKKQQIIQAWVLYQFSQTTFSFAHCTTRVDASASLFGWRPARQLAGQAAIWAPGVQNRTRGNAACARQFIEDCNQTSPQQAHLSGTQYPCCYWKKTPLLYNLGFASFPLSFVVSTCVLCGYAYRTFLSEHIGHNKTVVISVGKSRSH